MSFDAASGSPPDQHFTLTRDAHGVVDYALNAAKFSSISRLCLHFPRNFGAANTRIYYIGLRGEFQHGFARQTVGSHLLACNSPTSK
jgi:hypothetical protein